LRAIIDEPPKEAMFDDIAKPETIGRRIIKLHKKAIVLWRVRLQPEPCHRGTEITVNHR
jgi:hypothetical protein